MSCWATRININCGVVVDTHVARLSQRLGLTKETAPEKIEQELMKLVPRAAVDDVQPLADLAWPPPLFRAQARIAPAVRSRRFVRGSVCPNELPAKMVPMLSPEPRKAEFRPRPLSSARNEWRRGGTHLASL